MAAFGVVWRSIQRDCLYHPRWSRQEQVRGKARQLRRCLQETGEQLARSSQFPNPDSKDTLAEVRIPVVWSDGGGIKSGASPRTETAPNRFLFWLLYHIEGTDGMDRRGRQRIFRENASRSPQEAVHRIHREYRQGEDSAALCEVCSGFDPQKET